METKKGVASLRQPGVVEHSLTSLFWLGVKLLTIIGSSRGLENSGT